MMDTPKKLIYWVVGAAGIMLVYSGYKHKSPLSELQSFFGGSTATTTASGAQPTGAASVNASTSPVASNPDAVQPQDYQASQYSGAYTNDGTYVYDSNGNPVGEVPNTYKGSPGTFIPSANAL